jgi:hypothetical protein
MELLTVQSPIPDSYELVTVGAAAIPLTPARYRNRSAGDRPRSAKRALLTIETAPLRYTVDGTVPTATIGHLLPIGASLELLGYDAIAGFQAIRTTATSAELHVTYFGA